MNIVRGNSHSGSILFDRILATQAEIWYGYYTVDYDINTMIIVCSNRGVCIFDDGVRNMTHNFCGEAIDVESRIIDIERGLLKLINNNDYPECNTNEILNGWLEGLP